MIIDNVLIIPDDGIENFTLSLVQDGIAWEDLTVTVTIQLQLSGLYWNGTDWQAGAIAMDATEALPGQYKYTNVGEDAMYLENEILDVTWLALEDATPVYSQTYEMPMVYGIAPLKQKVRDAMTLATEETAAGGSVDKKLDDITVNQGTDKGEIIAAVTAKLAEGHIVEEE